MSPYTEHATSRLLNPIRLEGEIQFHQAQDQQVTIHKWHSSSVEAMPSSKFYKSENDPCWVVHFSVSWLRPYSERNVLETKRVQINGTAWII